ncbi:hypothetical protein DYB32_006319 [Aphanomyces invadans]|uniref:Peptidase C1A papain C-terminal domain-containing protein n=1 Tax=Aphanomyces invadans TaxID=157072 RepID=A0A3R6V8S9_9STRA|nr:hypothetical protein DYB32_006319 [Aphanomyces invadans]
MVVCVARYHTRGGVVAAMLPIKFAVSHVTPYKDQAGRGTCWDFGTIGALEQSYRKHGVEQGWLNATDYVSFSEQAYGIEVMELCTGSAGSPQQRACRVADDNVWRNSTEGGEVPLLYYLQTGLKDSVFPTRVCPYQPTEGHDWDCSELQNVSIRKSNPLAFNVTAMGTFYEQASIKHKLVETGLAMPLSTTLVSVQHMYPPFNWYVPTEDDGVVDIAACLSDDSMAYAELNRQPLHLSCVDDTYCVPGRTYFAKNRTTWGDRMHVMCFWEYEHKDNSSQHVCFPPMLQEALATTLEPVEVYENDADLCGFYFLPYATVSQVSAQFQGFFVNSFEVEWARQSYAAHRADYPDLDYSLVEASTFPQHATDRFYGPFPFARQYKPHDPSQRHRHQNLVL